MKSYTKLLIILLTILNISGASLQWDPSPDINISKYNIYIRTNGIANTNFYKVVTTASNILTAPISAPSGTSVTYYATAENSDLLESDPSNFVDVFMPIGVPPENILISASIQSYNNSTKMWSNVKIAWNPVDPRYGINMFMVYLVTPTSTNVYNTTFTSFTFPSLPLNDYKLYVLTTNILGNSPFSTKSVWEISKQSPSKVTGLRSL